VCALSRQLPANRVAALLYSRIKKQIGVSDGDHQPVRLRVHRGISGGRRRRPGRAVGPTARLEFEARRSTHSKRSRTTGSRRHSGRSTASSQSKGRRPSATPCRTTMKPSGKSMPRSTSRR